jgi:lysyl-tRNA synthetase class II
MATLKELRDERLRKLEELKQLGINPYPARANRTHDLQGIHAGFTDLEGQTVTVVGRITSIRKFGKIAFIVIRDDTDELQLFWRASDNTEADRANSELLMSDIALLDAAILSRLPALSSKRKQARSLSKLPSYDYSPSRFAPCQPNKTALRTKKSACVAVTSI